MRKSVLIVVLTVFAAILSSWAPGAIAIAAVLAGVVMLGVVATAALLAFNLLTGRAPPRTAATI